MFLYVLGNILGLSGSILPGANRADCLIQWTGLCTALENTD